MAAGPRCPAPTSTGTGGSVRFLHQRFVVAQIVMGAKNAAIHETLRQEDLDDIDDSALVRLRAQLSLPKKFTVKNRKHQPSVAYLDLLGVRDLAHRTPEAEEALQLLRAPRVREIVEVGLLVQAPLEALTAYVRKQKMLVGTMAIELFERWFWSVRAFDRATLRSLLEVRAMRRALRGANGDDERRVALRAARSDARVLAVSLPRSPLSWYVGLAALGHAPVGVPIDRVLEQLRSYAALRAFESVTRAAPGDDGRAAAFVSILRTAHELHQQVVPPDVALRDTLAAVRLTSDSSRVPLIHELSGGSHTVDVQGHHEGADDVAADPEEAGRS